LSSLSVTGSATAGSFIPSSATIPSNGIYLPAANSVAVATNGTEKLIVLSNGNVGIGTSSVNAGSKLHIARNTGGDSATVRLSGNDGAGDGGAAIIFADNETVKWTAFTRRYSSANKLYISTAEGDTSASKVTITEGGLVGIGTTSPSTGKLTLVSDIDPGTTAAGIAVSLTNIGGGAATSQYGIRVTGWGYNNSTNVYGVHSALTQQLLSPTYGGYFSAVGTYSAMYGIYGEATNSDGNSYNSVYAGYFKTNGSVAGTNGTNYGIRIENAATNGGTSYGAYLSTVAGATTVIPLRIDHAGSEKLRVDSSGRLLVGTSSEVGGIGASAKIQVKGNTTAGGGAKISFQRNQAAASIGSGEEVGQLVFASNDGGDYALITARSDGASSSTSDCPGRLEFSTTADGAASPTERMRINSLGNAFIGGGGATTQAATRLIITNPNATESQSSLIIENSSFFASIYCFTVNTGGVSTTSAAMWVQKSSSTSRSINAAGTINASGADYAEYMTKGGDFTITKGDICGIDPDGKLTTNFTNSISFAVKSTNPSYVGSDTWGSEAAIGKKPDVDDLEAYAQWESDLEAARQTVDRIAFAGQVPVNVTGATPGQYIVPVESADGGIEGIAKDEADLTLTEYMRAVGKVIAIEDDGRARIIVKVA